MNSEDRHYVKYLHDVPIAYLVKELNRRTRRNREIAEKMYKAFKLVAVRYSGNSYVIDNLRVEEVTDTHVFLYDNDFPERKYKISYADIEGIYGYSSGNR